MVLYWPTQLPFELAMTHLFHKWAHTFNFHAPHIYQILLGWAKVIKYMIRHRDIIVLVCKWFETTFHLSHSCLLTSISVKYRHIFMFKKIVHYCFGKKCTYLLTCFSLYLVIPAIKYPPSLDLKYSYKVSCNGVF